MAGGASAWRPRRSHVSVRRTRVVPLPARSATARPRPAVASTSPPARPSRPARATISTSSASPSARRARERRRWTRVPRAARSRLTTRIRARSRRPAPGTQSASASNRPAASDSAAPSAPRPMRRAIRPPAWHPFLRSFSSPGIRRAVVRGLDPLLGLGVGYAVRVLVVGGLARRELDEVLGGGAGPLAPRAAGLAAGLLPPEVSPVGELPPLDLAVNTPAT